MDNSTHFIWSISMQMVLRQFLFQKLENRRKPVEKIWILSLSARRIFRNSLFMNSFKHLFNQAKSFFSRRNWVSQCRNYKKRCLMMSFAIVKCSKCHSMTEQKFAFKTFSLTFLTILESLFWPHGKNLWKAPLWTSSQIVFHCLV